MHCTAEFTISIAATDYALQAVVIPFIAKLRTQAPGIRLSIRSVEDSRIQIQFERGDVDLTLMTPETAFPDSYARRLLDETYVSAMREGHPDASSEALSLVRFCALDHTLFSYSGERFWGVADDALAKSGRERRVALTVTGFLVLAGVLKTTDLITVSPSDLLKMLRVLSSAIRLSIYPASQRSRHGTSVLITTPAIVGRPPSCSRHADASILRVKPDLLAVEDHHLPALFPDAACTCWPARRICERMRDSASSVSRFFMALRICQCSWNATSLRSGTAPEIWR